MDRASGAKRLFATGLRNPNGMGWEPATRALWTVVNERDELGNDLVPDYLTSVKDGAFYGWPWSYWGQHVDDRVKPPKPDMVAKAIAPDYGLGSHVAPLGMTFSDARMPAPFASGVFVGEHGSWNRKPRSGYKVVFVPFKDGKPSGEPVDFLTGFVSQDGKAYGRPVGVALDSKGALAGRRRRGQHGLARRTRALSAVHAAAFRGKLPLSKNKGDGMKLNRPRVLVLAGVAAAVVAGCAATRSGPPITFFITSVNPAQSGNLGGLAGADATCEKLASAVGAGGRNWHAYLSTQEAAGAPAVNARDRIGKGPWTNAKGVVIAKDLAELHGRNNINKETGLTEKGEVVPATGDRAVNKHDILTGSKPDGTAMPPGRDATCSNWTSQQRRRRDGGPPQPHGHQSRPGGQRVVELLAHHARMRPAVAAARGRCGPVLLLRREVGRRPDGQIKSERGPAGIRADRPQARRAG